MKIYAYVIGVCFLATTVGCMSAADHQRSLHSSQERDFTLGLVQTRIARGMSQAQVAEALGSPNIATRDAEGDETWIYDKIATEASYSTDRGDVGGLAGAGGLAGNVLLLGGLTGGYSKAAGATATTQKTLTVVIKFDSRSRVKDFSYHSSKF
ncbi:MAG: outer membrane protein assembly factor BamE [Deltaproteobacteria bacterium]|nr:outer membrane protein assembly factor BamE [Deltaproteobacteria bacterium]